MKKILIVSHALELGGAERSLIGLLDAIDKKEYKVDLFLLRHEGELLSFIPEGVIYYLKFRPIQYLRVQWYRL